MCTAESVPHPKQFIVMIALKVKIFPFHKLQSVFTLAVLALKTFSQNGLWTFLISVISI